MNDLISPARHGIKRLTHRADFCVVGGGMAGLVAALAAARHGARTVLMHDRPVLGGNASSECRVHMCGADQSGHRPNLRETGILEELRLENLRRNAHSNFSVWDAILYEKARFQENLTLLLNCTCQAAQVQAGRIAGVTGWQLTTQTYHTVEAKVFADCSGDGILAPLTGADFRMGREGRDEYGESIAPERPDDRTMGMTCLFQTREYPTPQEYQPPSWVYRFPRDEDIPYASGDHGRWWTLGYWWVELGGQHHSIHDTEKCRDELLKIALGVWDHIKNQGQHGADNWALEWLQFLPAKRESRRYVGDHVLTQLDIQAEGRFDDLVAYGGWSMDDHHPEGFWAVKIGAPATIFHPAPAPYGIPYRALCSRNVQNLMFAGRTASCTHAAMSSTRVMGTGCSMGQAVGTAAAIACRDGLTPRQVGIQRLAELKQTLLRDDCYLPWQKQDLSALTTAAQLSASQGDPEPLRDGVNRTVGNVGHFWMHSPGDWAAYRLAGAAQVKEATLVLDSMLDRGISMSLHGSYGQLTSPPPMLAKALHVDVLLDGSWTTVFQTQDNCQRLIRVPIGRQVEAVRYGLDATWGETTSRLFAFYLD